VGPSAVSGRRREGTDRACRGGAARGRRPRRPDRSAGTGCGRAAGARLGVTARTCCSAWRAPSCWGRRTCPRPSSSRRTTAAGERVAHIGGQANRPSAARGNDRAARDRRSRGNAIRPWRHEERTVTSDAAPVSALGRTGTPAVPRSAGPGHRWLAVHDLPCRGRREVRSRCNTRGCLTWPGRG
jgi:hypothetical protein